MIDIPLFGPSALHRGKREKYCDLVSDGHNYIDKNFSHEYQINDSTRLVQVYQSAQDECLEIDLSFTVLKDANLEFTPIILGFGSYKITLTFFLEENAQAKIKGAYALAGTQQCAINTYQYHVGKDATSNLSLHGIASQQALADYRGMIRIEQKASGTSATQENKTILLGDRARATSIPSIEVLNHDVSCAHGSAIGPLDRTHILYAQSRGMNVHQAQKMIVHSFFAQMLDMLSADNQKDLLLEHLVSRVIRQKE